MVMVGSYQWRAKPINLNIVVLLRFLFKNCIFLSCMLAVSYMNKGPQLRGIDFEGLFNGGWFLRF